MHKRTQTQLDAVDAMDCWLPCQPLFNPDGYCKGDCFKKCPDVCRVLVADVSPFSLPVTPPPPVQQFPPPIIHKQQDEISKKHLISTSMTIASCFLGATLILGILGMMLRAYCKRQRNPRTRSTPIIFGTEEDFANEEQGPEIDHPIWYINTVGLQQSVIDSIVVFKYNKGEGLVDGTECSVCLNDFQEDENLRLLPKCSHAFHLPCIDTWLRSHKNCPLCRAPIVSANAEAEFVPSVPTTSDLNSREEPQMGNFDGSSSLSDSNQEGEDGTSEVRIGVGNSGVSLTSDDETNDGNRSSKMNGDRSSLRDHVRVRSDLVGIREDVEAEMQPMRRSVSLDSSSASVIYNAVSHVIPDKDQVKVDPKQSKHSRGKRVIKQGSTESLSFRKLMKSSSIGRSLQRGPVLMKRSFSSSEKPLSSLSCGESRRHDSMLPL